MNLPRFSTERPVTVTMIFLGVILLGIISWNRLPQELFPPLTYPQLTVVTSYPNAAPEEIESLITKPIEEATGTVKGLKRISSTSKEGVSLVFIDFAWGTNMDFASLETREKLDLIKERLPREAEEPVVMKYNPFSLPIMSLSVTGTGSSEELYDISKRLLKEKIEKTPGVASCTLSGGREREIQIEVEGARLYAQDIDLLQVVDALHSANLNYPAGSTEDNFFEWLVRTIGEFKTVQEISQTPVALDEPRKERRLIFLKDIASIKDSFKERQSYSRFNGRDNVSASIQKQSQANTIQTVKNIKQTLRDLRKNLPEGVETEVVYDGSVFIKNAISGVRNAAILGGILAYLVLLFFLRSMRSSIIVTFSIPISIMAALACMYFAQININIISLGGLALGVGMLVDNAIVVMENIFRHKRQGKPFKEAACAGADEVNQAISASTFSTVAVFLPMVFIVGIAGQIFKQLAFTVTFSLLASLFVALSLIPRMAMNIKERQTTYVGPFRFIDKLFSKVNNFYERILPRFLAKKIRNLFIILFLFLATMFLFFIMDKEFMPRVDRGEFLIKIDMPTGTKLDVTNAITKKIEEVLLNNPEIKNVVTNVGANREEMAPEAVRALSTHQARMIIKLISGRRARTARFVQEIKKSLSGINLEGADVEFLLQESILQEAQLEQTLPVVVEIKGHNLDILDKIAGEVKQNLERVPGLYGVKSDIERPAPETRIRVLKDKASLYGLSARDIALTSHIAIDGWVASRFKQEGREIDIRVRLRPEDRKDFQVLKQLTIHAPDGTSVPLDAVTEIVTGTGPSRIKRVDQERTVLVMANTFGRGLGRMIDDVNKRLKNISVPLGYSLTLSGESQKMSESFKSLRFALILAVILVYMIMAAQFESLWQPFVIMFTLPLSLMGVAFALFITHTTLNVVAILGIIMLGGIVVNNGIVLLDYINKLKKQGLTSYEAVLSASRVRLRPIFMTTLTTVLALFPLALGLGEGAELRSPLAITVMGGLLVSTFLTLLVIPAIYLIVDNFILRRKG